MTVTEEQQKEDGELMRKLNEGDAGAMCALIRNAFQRENVGHVNLKLVENFKKLPAEEQMEFMLLGVLRAGANLNQLNSIVFPLFNNITVAVAGTPAPPKESQH